MEFHNRQAWSRIRLDLEGGELTCAAWRAYQARYLKASMQVLDKTPQEEREKIFLQLPNEWRQKIVNEESKRRGRQWWVRISGPGLKLEDLAILADGIWDDVTPLDAHRTDLVGTYDIRCPQEQWHKRLKAKDGTQVNGRTVCVTHKKIR